MIDLTPLDVRKKRGDFRRLLRGYDPEEVDTFMELVADRFEELVRENLALRERTDRLESQLQALEGRESAVQEALVTAQKLREDVKEETRRDAEVVKDQATRTAELLKAEAESEITRRLAEVEAEITRRLGEAESLIRERQFALEDLERSRLKFLKSFRGLLEREMDAVDVEEARRPLEETPLELEFRGWMPGPASSEDESDIPDEPAVSTAEEPAVFVPDEPAVPTEDEPDLSVADEPEVSLADEPAEDVEVTTEVDPWAEAIAKDFDVPDHENAETLEGTEPETDGSFTSVPGGTFNDSLDTVPDADLDDTLAAVSNFAVEDDEAVSSDSEPTDEWTSEPEVVNPEPVAFVDEGPGSEDGMKPAEAVGSPSGFETQVLETAALTVDSPTAETDPDQDGSAEGDEDDGDETPKEPKWLFSLLKKEEEREGQP